MTSSLIGSLTTSRAAFDGLYDQFVADSSQRFHIKYSETGRPYTFPGGVDRHQFCLHLGGQDCYGVRFSERSRFALIDMDLHAGDFDVFVKQLEILVWWASRQDERWHVQVAVNDASGIHLILALPEAVKTAILRQRIRIALQKLDQQNPTQRRQIIEANHERVELMRKWGCDGEFKLLDRHEQMVIRRAGMKSLSQVEVFPHDHLAVRLPLASGRVILCDQPVYDPDGYWNWLTSTQKTMSPAAILGFVIPRLVERPLNDAIQSNCSSLKSSAYPLARDFEFTPDEFDLIDSVIAKILAANCETTRKVVKWFLRFVAAHDGEIAQAWLPDLLCEFAVNIRNRNKQSKLLTALVENNWIVIVREARWATPAMKAQGMPTRARTYAIADRFFARVGSQGWDLPVLLRNVPDWYKSRFISGRNVYT